MMVYFFFSSDCTMLSTLQGFVSHPAATAMIGKDVINCHPGDLTLLVKQNVVREANGNYIT